MNWQHCVLGDFSPCSRQGIAEGSTALPVDLENGEPVFLCDTSEDADRMQDALAKKCRVR